MVILCAIRVQWKQKGNRNVRNVGGGIMILHDINAVINATKMGDRNEISRTSKTIFSSS